MFKKLISIIMVMCILTIFSVNVFANGHLNNIINQGSNLSGSGGNIGSDISNLIYNTFIPIIGMFGNLIFASVTVILGLKYIWSSADGKAEVQESLPAFVVAVVFFYLAGSIVSFATSATAGISGANNWDKFSGNFLWIINTVVKYAALAGVIYMGVKYMLASAEGRASMKTSMTGVVIGLVFVFLATNVVEFFVGTGKDILH